MQKKPRSDPCSARPAFPPCPLDPLVHVDAHDQVDQATTTTTNDERQTTTVGSQLFNGSMRRTAKYSMQGRSVSKLTWSFGRYQVSPPAAGSPACLPACTLDKSQSEFAGRDCGDTSHEPNKGYYEHSIERNLLTSGKSVEGKCGYIAWTGFLEMGSRRRKHKAKGKKEYVLHALGPIVMVDRGVEKGSSDEETGTAPNGTRMVQHLAERGR